MTVVLESLSKEQKMQLKDLMFKVNIKLIEYTRGIVDRFVDGEVKRGGELDSNTVFEIGIRVHYQLGMQFMAEYMKDFLNSTNKAYITTSGLND